MQKLIVEINIPDVPRFSREGRFSDASNVLRGTSDALHFMCPEVGVKNTLCLISGKEIGTITLVEVPDLKEEMDDAAES